MIKQKRAPVYLLANTAVGQARLPAGRNVIINGFWK